MGAARRLTLPELLGAFDADQPPIYWVAVGAIAQLGERCPRTAEVRGSNPLRSTNVPDRTPRLVGR
jgi:hypothetical protein